MEAATYGKRGPRVGWVVRQTGDPWLDLWAGILRQAIDDANKRHDRSAAQWLWQHEPVIAEQALRCDCE